MEVGRKPFQGIWNIIRFNWHFYLIAFALICLLGLFYELLPVSIHIWVLTICIMTIITISISLLISYYIYDLSPLYQMKWLENLNYKKVLNINAGFDETSDIIKSKFPKAELTIVDFYNPAKHTEVSIKRARKAYPPSSNTLPVSTEKLPFKSESFDKVIGVLSIHEIRSNAERVQFFKELSRIVNYDGQIIITEHLRDFYNFMAYTIGFFHFHHKSTWVSTFHQANLIIRKEIKTTPFISTFILERDGTAS